jgi:hypothetical protein
MLKAATWIQPRKEWDKHHAMPGHIVMFRCGCGDYAHAYLDKGEDQTTLACRKCERTEHNRLYMRKRRGSDVPHDPRPCGHCGQVFQPERTTARYCSTRCRVAAHRSSKRPKKPARKKAGKP